MVVVVVFPTNLCSKVKRDDLNTDIYNSKPGVKVLFVYIRSPGEGSKVDQLKVLLLILWEKLKVFK